MIIVMIIMIIVMSIIHHCDNQYDHCDEYHGNNQDETGGHENYYNDLKSSDHDHGNDKNVIMMMTKT